MSDATYLQELHALGCVPAEPARRSSFRKPVQTAPAHSPPQTRGRRYEAYLDNCYKQGLPQLEKEVGRVLDGARCLAIVEQGNDVETDAQTMLFGCLIGGVCERSAQELAHRQHIPSAKYVAFTSALVRHSKHGEVDLVLVKRTPEQLAGP